LSRRVALLVPDAGPLISLARGSALDVLLLLGLPIHVVDQVRYEATKDRRFPDAVAIETFLRAHPGRVYEFETWVGRSAAAARETAGPIRQPGLGEAAMAEFLARLDEIIDVENGAALLLFEDSDVLHRSFSLPRNVHVLSTRALLLGLQARGAIASAEDIWQRIRRGGRTPNDRLVDQPGVVSGKQTTW
jgi:hypothetical protein